MTRFRKRWLFWGLAAAGLVLFLPLALYLSRQAQIREARVAAYRARDGLATWRKAEVIRLQPVDKAWVENAAGSRYDHSAGVCFPGPEGRLVGYSGLEPTEEEAAQGARRALKEQLQALLESELQKNCKDAGTREALRRIDAAAESLLASPRTVVDRIQERVKLPRSGVIAHGTALLFQVPDRWLQDSVQRIEKEVHAAHRELREQRRSFGWTVLSALLLGLVTFFVYSFLNAGSKGHLAWPLRIISLAAYLIICLGLFIARGHLT